MALFGSEKLFNIADEQEILRGLSSRKHWSEIRKEVLQALIANAGKDVLKISRFVFVSEYYDCVRNNFVALSRIWDDPRLALSAFAATLVGLAADIIQHLGVLPEGSEQQSQAMGLVEISFLSALLCDPYMLTAYRGLASFYYGIGKTQQGLSMCKSFDETEQKLLKAGDEYSRQYRETKYKPAAAAMRSEIDRLKVQLKSSG